MFTGIIEKLGEVKKITPEGTNLRFEIASSLYTELKVDQSLSHNGVCLTVEKINSNTYEVVAVKETLNKSNLATLQNGSLVNLERCMQMNGRLDGHIVQGHVDETAILDSLKEEKGSWLFTFQLKNPSPLTVEKGSICINGISLTLFDIKDDKFSVTIIPYTYEHTNLKELKIGNQVNIEFDIIGKYIQRMQTLKN
tara:strand:+ start:756 stop:1343 length:588 start_codon:yes stop_codon:yes gene_type:complete